MVEAPYSVELLKALGSIASSHVCLSLDVALSPVNDRI